MPHKRGSVDSIRGGNEVRFVNHSDTPNCFTTSRVAQGMVRIGFYADRTIKKGEEMYFNYNYSKEIQEVMFHMSPEQRVLKFQMEMEKRKTTKMKDTKKSRPSTSTAMDSGSDEE